MARLPRAALPGIPQHVTQRGNNRQACFFAEEDYAVYLDRLKHYAEQYQVLVHAYILMTNHVHLLLTPKTKEGVSCLMQALGRYYVRYINQSYRRSGTLWDVLLEGPALSSITPQAITNVFDGALVTMSATTFSPGIGLSYGSLNIGDYSHAFSVDVVYGYDIGHTGFRAIARVDSDFKPGFHVH